METMVDLSAILSKIEDLVNDGKLFLAERAEAHIQQIKVDGKEYDLFLVCKLKSKDKPI